MSKDHLCEFLEEARESLSDLDSHVNNLNSLDEVKFLFRHIHSLKGSASYYKVDSLALLSHKIEDLLDQVRRKKKTVSKEIIELLNVGFSYLKEIVERCLCNEFDMPKNAKMFLERLILFLDKSEDLLSIEDIYDKLNKGIYESVEDLRVDLGDKLSALQDSQKNKNIVHPKIELIKDCLLNEINSEKTFDFNGMSEICEEVLKYYSDHDQDQYTSNLHHFCDNFVVLFKSGIEINDRLADSLLSDLLDSSADLYKADEIISINKSSSTDDKSSLLGKNGHSDTTVRIKVQLLEQVMDLMGELVLSRNQLNSYNEHHHDAELGVITQNISMITSDLQEKVMKTRLQPVSNVFRPIPTVVREMSRKLGKKVILETDGEATELDRTILNGIKDPLIHVVRNSLDHGVERPSERLKLGKCESASLKLKAYHEGSLVVIEIYDDGGGIDIDKVKCRVIELGVLSGEDLVGMSDDEVIQLIFHSGFSSSNEVSELSGRGVGMDVVKSHIESMGGHVEIENSKGFGLNVKFKIPLTLAIIPALIVEVDDYQYAVPQENLVEMVLVKADDPNLSFEELNGCTVLRMRGKILQVIRLNELLGIPISSEEWDEVHVIVLKYGGNSFGLIVEVLHDIQEIVVKSLDHFLEGHELFSGATILGDGSVSLILDTLLIAESFHMSKNRGINECAVRENKPSSDEKVNGGSQLLIFSLQPSLRYGVLLDGVYRLENIKSSRIESLSGKWFLQYRGAVLPLISSWEVMDVEVEVLPEDVNVIVFVESDQEIGLVVGSIEDTVMMNNPIVSNIVVDNRNLGCSIVDDKILTILNLKYFAERLLSDDDLEMNSLSKIEFLDQNVLSGESR
jgi:two-component system chemotaxis sensor kinase CheA